MKLRLQSPLPAKVESGCGVRFKPSSSINLKIVCEDSRKAEFTERLPFVGLYSNLS